MNRSVGFVFLPMMALSIAFCTVGCHKDQAALAASNGQSGVQDQASDPAAANLAPANANTAVPASYNRANEAQQQPSSPSGTAVPYDVGPDQNTDDPGYGAQPAYYASQPPPPLPDYDQPPAPGDGYLWTPGYWGYTEDGYYWVPGVWVQAPYEGALWTPGYWGFWHHHYGFYRGYWGQHIGYYGGIDYGFGYVGLGYQGGYWGGGHFNYNRAVNNVNSDVVHNVYNHSVMQNNRGSARVSFNGGQGGVPVRARPAELAARREMHSAPMSAQVQNEHSASSNRSQFAHGDQGRPANLTVSQPLAADHNIRVPAAAVQQQNRETEQQRRVVETHSSSVQSQVRGGDSSQSQPAQNQKKQREAAPQPQHQAAPQPQHQAAPQPQQHQAARQQKQQAPAAEKPVDHPKI